MTSDELARWLREHVRPTLDAVNTAHLSAAHVDATIARAVLDKAISPFVYWVRDNPASSSGSASHSQPLPGPSTPFPNADGEMEIVVAGISLAHVKTTSEERIVPDGYLEREDWMNVAKSLGPAWKWSKEDRAFVRPLGGGNRAVR